MRFRKNKVLISAKCSHSSKKIIRDSRYTYGDALDFFARVISNRHTRIQAYIKLVEAEIHELNMEIEKNRTDLNAKKRFKKQLLRDLNSSRSHYLSDNEKQLQESISTIKKIAANLDCDPLDIDIHTGSSTLNYHAQKCRIPVYELEKALNPEKVSE